MKRLGRSSTNIANELPTGFIHVWGLPVRVQARAHMLEEK